MKYFFILIISMLFCVLSNAQTTLPVSPCTTDSVYRQFDFWVGDWEAYNLQGKKSGNSKISLILDSCTVLEEWTSMPLPNGFTYAGKSFNTYNALTKQWQQTWVDNVGGNINYTHGKYENNKIIFETDALPFSKDSTVINRLTFFNLGPDKVRQLGEMSKDNGKNWVVQYDLDYRRKK